VRKRRIKGKLSRYFSGQLIPRSRLSTRTNRSLSYLEKELGFKFENEALKANFGYRPSYLIFGTSPKGEDAVYERRETSSPGAGQTYIWVGEERHRLGDFGLGGGYIPKKELK